MPGAYTSVPPVRQPSTFWSAPLQPNLTRDLSVIVDADLDKATRATALPATNSVTFFTFAKLLSNTGNFQTFSSLDDGGGTYQVFETDSATLIPTVFDGPANNVAGTAMTVGNWYALGYSSDGTTLRLYMRDVTSGTAGVMTTATARAGSAAVTGLTIAGSPFSEVPNAAFRGPRWFRTAFTTQIEFDAECSSFSPVHATAVRDSWFNWRDTSADEMTTDQSGNARHLTRGAGAWTVSDTPPLMPFSSGVYTMMAVSGSIPITGSAAALRRALVLTAASGSVPITGSAANTLKQYRMTAVSGSIPITGTAVAFRRTYVLAATSGAVPITGSAAALRRSLVLTATSGSVPITGSAVTLRRALRVQATSGAVPITGSTAGLLVAHKMPAASGAVPITGSTVTLRRALRLIAASGAVPITGSAASLIVAHKLTAASGAVPITGSAVTLTKGIRLTAASGSVPITGSTVNLRVARKMQAASGAVPIIGSAAVLTKGIRLTAASGSVPIIGSAAVLRRTYVLAAGAGAVPITGTDVALVLLSGGPSGVSFPAMFGTEPSKVVSVSDETENVVTASESKTNTSSGRSYV